MQPSRTPVDPVDDLVIAKRATVPLPPATAFNLFVEPAALERWLCAKARVEARVGGAYELFWAPDDPHNDSTIGCRISALDTGRLLAFQWRSPRQFKSFANAADPLTHVVVVFHGHERDTVITLLHSGWRSTPEWVQAAQWQSAAWDYALKALNGHAAGMTR